MDTSISIKLTFVQSLIYTTQIHCRYNLIRCDIPFLVYISRSKRVSIVTEKLSRAILMLL